MNLLAGYRDSTNASAQDAFKYITEHRRAITDEYGVNTVREMILNYRTYFKKDQKARIVDEYKKYVMAKSQQHKSDLAIGHNIVKYIALPAEDEAVIVDYLFNRLADELHNNQAVSNNQFFKKYLVINYISKNILITKK